MITPGTSRQQRWRKEKDGGSSREEEYPCIRAHRRGTWRGRIPCALCVRAYVRASCVRACVRAREDLLIGRAQVYEGGPISPLPPLLHPSTTATPRQRRRHCENTHTWFAELYDRLLIGRSVCQPDPPISSGPDAAAHEAVYGIVREGTCLRGRVTVVAATRSIAVATSFPSSSGPLPVPPSSSRPLYSRIPPP